MSPITTPTFTKVGRYLLSPPIASGGMATVHIARPVSVDGLARTVAVKRMHSHLARDRDVATMFRDEARLSMRIQHPNVAAVLDVVELDGELLLVMEYVAGTSMSHIVQYLAAKGKRLPFGVTVANLCDALSGLHAAHEALDEHGEPLGVIHRDFSPHNLLIGADGVLRVTDFGVAKSRGRLRTTRDGLVRGKLGYMAPEQIRGGDLSRRVDIFSAGIVLWEALVGRPLFSGEGEGEIMYKILEAPIRTPRSVAADVPPELDEIVMKALDRDPERRFATASDMARAIERSVSRSSASTVSSVVHTILGTEIEERLTLVRALERAASTPEPPPPPPVVPEVSFHPRRDADAIRAQVDIAARGPGARHEVVRRPEKPEKGAEGGVLVPFLVLVVVASLVGFGFAYREAIAPVVDAPSTASLAFKCELDEFKACHNLGVLYEAGDELPMDRHRATDLYRRACDGGSSDGCIGLARMLEADDAPEAFERRLELLDKACAAGNQVGCSTLGKTLIVEGKGKDDRSRGIALMEGACNVFVLESCTALGVLYLDGKSLPKDLSKASALCQKACDRQDQLACSCAAKVKQLAP